MKEMIDIANRKLTITLGADHGAFESKNAVADFLRELGHNVVDCGAFVMNSEDDYPDFAVPAARAVSLGTADPESESASPPTVTMVSVPPSAICRKLSFPAVSTIAQTASSSAATTFLWTK